MKEILRAFLVVTSTFTCLSQPWPTEAISTEAPTLKLPLPENFELEKLLINQFEDAFWHSESSTNSMRKLLDYYRWTGREKKFDDKIDSMFGETHGLCGSFQVRMAEVVLRCCLELKENNEPELLSKCLPYAGRLTVKPEFQDPEVLKLSKLASTGTFGYYDGNDVLTVGCATAACLEAVSQFKRPLSIRLLTQTRQLDLTPLKGMPNILKFQLLEPHAETLSLLPTLSGLRSLSTTPDILPQLDSLTLSRIVDLEIYCPSQLNAVDRTWGQLSNLKTLTVHCKGLSRQSMRSIANILRLERLVLNSYGPRNVDIKNVCEISSLRDLSLQVEGLSHLPPLENLANLENLESLDFSGTAIGDSQLRKLTGLGALKSLVLARTNVRNDLSALKSLKKLSTLDLSGCHISTAGLESISDLKTLEELDLSATGLSATQVGCLSNLPNLRKLVFEPHSDDEDEWLSTLSSLPRLREISFPFVTDAPRKLETISHSESLEIVKIPHYYSFSEGNVLNDGNVAVLSSLPNLKHLELHSEGLTGACFRSGFQCVEELDLSGCPVTDSSLEIIAKLPALRKLQIDGNALTVNSLNLLGTQTNLEGITIHKLRLDDSAIDAFRSLIRIPKVTLSCTRLSLDGLHQLKSILPTSSIFPDPEELERLLAGTLDLEKHQQNFSGRQF